MHRYTDSKTEFRMLIIECFYSKNNEIHLIRVPGHQGMKGNEKAEKLVPMVSHIIFTG